jgi:AcrR family transcriptional regulator
MSDPPVKPDPPKPPRRPYKSPKRDQAARNTHRRIREAAQKLFLRDGYTRTSMRAIAKEAGVSEKTMYLTYASKAMLLRHVIDVAAGGDEALMPAPQRPDWVQHLDDVAAGGDETLMPAPQRPDWLRQLDDVGAGGDEALIPAPQRSQWRAIFAGPPHEILARFAAQNATVMTRTAAIVALAESAADSDAELAEQRDDAHRATRDDLRALAAALDRLGVLAPSVSQQDAADIIYALASDAGIYLRLTRECGWTEAGYADLIARALDATLANHQTPTPPSSSPHEA